MFPTVTTHINDKDTYAAPYYWDVTHLYVDISPSASKLSSMKGSHALSPVLVDTVTLFGPCFS